MIFVKMNRLTLAMCKGCSGMTPGEACALEHNLKNTVLYDFCF